MLFRLRGSVSNRGVIADVHDPDIRLRVNVPDRLCADFRGADRHENVNLAAELSRRPGDAPAVVAVRRGDKDHAADLVRVFRLFQIGKTDGLRIQPQSLADNARQGVEPAQRLEGVQAKPLGFVLHKHGAHSELLCHAVQPDERGITVVRHFLVDPVRRGGGLRRQERRSLFGRFVLVLYDRNRTDFTFFHTIPPGSRYPIYWLCLHCSTVLEICNISVEESAVCVSLSCSFW